MLRERIRDTLEMHGPSPWRRRAVYALIVYYFGVWAGNLEFAPARWLLTKLYGVVHLVTLFFTDVHIHRKMQLPGKGLHIIHSSSIYIHPSVVIGERLGLMHNVCIGTNMRSGGGVPTIGDDVFIGVGASILGAIKIGDGARIAANSFVINDVPAGATAIGVPAKIIRMPSVHEQERVRKARKEQDGRSDASGIQRGPLSASVEKGA